MYFIVLFFLVTRRICLASLVILIGFSLPTLNISKLLFCLFSKIITHSTRSFIYKKSQIDLPLPQIMNFLSLFSAFFKKLGSTCDVFSSNLSYGP